MKRYKQIIKDALFMMGTLIAVFFLNLLMQKLLDTKTLIPMIFVLGVFLISVNTQGYLWGIFASLISVLAVNYAFTYPFYAFDLMSPECVSSAIVMLVVAIVTGALTTKIKNQEKIKAEGEKERMRANLLRAVSHDLRTPLTTIYGSCAAIMENYDSLKREQHLKLLGEVREDAQWLLRMVENLLSITRIDGEKVQVTKSPTALEELIDIVLVKFRKHYEQQKVEVQIPEEFICIPMDAMLIEQVLINLLENAVHHAKGMTELKLSVYTEKQQVRFCVSDNGCGISPDKLENLFTGYLERENSLMDSSRSNMGIGLSVCATIVRAHGGEIYARNNPAGGASFCFTLKMEDEDEQ